MKELKELIKSFSHAINGVRFCINNERNFRTHIVAIFYVLFFGFLAKIHIYEFVVLFICFAQVLACELFNTAVELLCNKTSNGFDIYVKRSKDISAAGVLVCAMSCVIIGGLIFGTKIPQILENFNIYYCGFFIISLPLTTTFIFKRRK